MPSNFYILVTLMTKQSQRLIYTWKWYSCPSLSQKLGGRAQEVGLGDVGGVGGWVGGVGGVGWVQQGKV
jgi:hypothetical protein